MEDGFRLEAEEASAAGAGASAAPAQVDPFGRFLKVADVAASIGLSRAMIYKLMHAGPDPFPPPVKIGGASLWVEQEVVEWKARRVRDRAR